MDGPAVCALPGPQAAASAAVEQARVLYDNGLTGVLDVLDALHAQQQVGDGAGVVVAAGDSDAQQGHGDGSVGGMRAG